MKRIQMLAMAAALLSFGAASPDALAPAQPVDRPRPFRRDQSLPMMGGGRRQFGRTAPKKYPYTEANRARLAKAEAKRLRRRQRNLAHRVPGARLRWFRDPDGDIGISPTGTWSDHVGIAWTDGGAAVARPPAPFTGTVDWDHFDLPTQLEAVLAVGRSLSARLGAAAVPAFPVELLRSAA